MAKAKEELELDPHNARIHDAENKKLVKKSFDELGAGRSGLADAENKMIAGNLSYETAKAKGMPIKVIETDGSEYIVLKRTDLAYNDPKRKALAIVDNSATDKSSFKDEVFEMEVFEDVDLEEWGLERPEEETQLEAKEDDYQIPDVIHTDIVKGDLFEFVKGDLRHRLLCGDSTSIDDIDKLMDGEKADMVFTDPPYGMKKEGEGVENDNLNYNDLLSFNKEWIPISFSRHVRYRKLVLLGH